MPQILYCRREIPSRKTVLVLQENPNHKEYAKGKRKLKHLNVFSVLFILSHVMCEPKRDLEYLRQCIKYFKCPRAISHQLEQS